MRIRWERIIAVIALIIFVYLFCKLQPLLSTMLESASQNHGHDPLFARVLMLGIFCLTFVAVIKIMFTRR